MTQKIVFGHLTKCLQGLHCRFYSVSSEILGKSKEISRPTADKSSDVNFLPFNEPAPEKMSILSPESGKQIDLSTYAPEVQPTFNFAAYANRSPTLQKLIDLGVELSKFDKRPGIPQFLLGLDFERDMKDHIQFLHDVGVPADSLGRYLTINPLIFKEDIESLQSRVDYLKSIHYGPSMISTIISHNPYWLMFSCERIQNRLKFFREHFHLEEKACRKLVCIAPKIFTYNIHDIQVASFSIKEEMGFIPTEITRMLFNSPKIWTISNRSLTDRFNCVHNEMKIPHWQISYHSRVLLCRVQRLRQRHLFLDSLGLAQYDSKLPRYVPLTNLVSGTDPEFAVDVAHSSMKAFSNFLKTI